MSSVLGLDNDTKIEDEIELLKFISKFFENNPQQEMYEELFKDEHFSKNLLVNKYEINRISLIPLVMTEKHRNIKPKDAYIRSSLIECIIQGAIESSNENINFWSPCTERILEGRSRMKFIEKEKKVGLNAPMGTLWIMNMSNIHWTLVHLVIRKGELEATLYDSYDEKVMKEKIIQKVNKILNVFGMTVQIQIANINQQKDSYSCGLFTIMHALKLIFKGSSEKVYFDKLKKYILYKSVDEIVKKDPNAVWHNLEKYLKEDHSALILGEETISMEDGGVVTLSEIRALKADYWEKSEAEELKDCLSDKRRVDNKREEQKMQRLSKTISGCYSIKKAIQKGRIKKTFRQKLSKHLERSKFN